MTIRFLSAKELKLTLPFIKLLNPTLSDAELAERLANIQQPNYQCVGVFDDSEKLLAICGLWLLYKHYIGKHVEPDNVIVHPSQRGKGYGKIMMNWIDTWAREQGNICLELNAYKEDSKARSFWESQGYEWVGVHYRKRLD
jgi:GNAT superfamily N-acetyltransferase